MQVQASALLTRSSGSDLELRLSNGSGSRRSASPTMDNGYSFEVSVAVQGNVVNAMRSYLRSNQATGVGGRGLMTGQFADDVMSVTGIRPYAGSSWADRITRCHFAFSPTMCRPSSSAPAGRAAAPQALIFRWAASEAMPFTRSSDSLLTSARCVPAGAATCHQSVAS